MDIQITNSLPEATWKQFVDCHPDGNIFHTPEMFAVMQRAQGHKPQLWAAVNGEGSVLALFTPVQIVLNRHLHFLTSRAVSYGGVLCEPSQEGLEALALLLRTYRHKTGTKLLFTELRNLSDLGAIRPILEQEGFVYEEHINYLVNLRRSPDAILESFGTRTRKNIRQGISKGIVAIEEVVCREQLATCYGLLRKTYDVAHVPLADSSLFEAAFDVLYPKGMIRFTLARVGQANAATSIALAYKDVIYNWYAGTDREHGAHNPMMLLTWDFLMWGAKRNYRVYDLGGAGKPDEKYGVRDFKAKFAGDLVCFGRNTLVHAPLRMAVSTRGYQWVKRFLF